MSEIEQIKETVTDFLTEVENSKLQREPLKDSGYTTNVNEWLEFHDKVKEENSHTLINDYEVVKNATAYSLEAVISYKGKMETMATFRYKSIDDLKEALKDKKYILYLIWQSIQTHTVDDKTFTFKPLENGPEISYIFRGIVLNE